VLTAAGFTVLRFTHAQVRHAPRRIEDRLAAVAGRLRVSAGCSVTD
jgi:very-short-patch-repair endonuclease